MKYSQLNHRDWGTVEDSGLDKVLLIVDAMCILGAK